MATKLKVKYWMDLGDLDMAIDGTYVYSYNDNRGKYLKKRKMTPVEKELYRLMAAAEDHGKKVRESIDNFKELLEIQ